MALGQNSLASGGIGTFSIAVFKEGYHRWLSVFTQYTAVLCCHLLYSYMSSLHFAVRAHRSEHFLPSIFTVLPAILIVSLSPRSMCSCMFSSGQQVSNGFMDVWVRSRRSYCRRHPPFSPGRGWSEGSGPPPRHAEEQAGSLGLVATEKHCHGRLLEWIVALQRGHERRLWSHLHQHRNKDIVWSSCGQEKGKVIPSKAILAARMRFLYACRDILKGVLRYRNETEDDAQGISTSDIVRCHELKWFQSSSAEETVAVHQS